MVGACVIPVVMKMMVLTSTWVDGRDEDTHVGLVIVCTHPFCVSVRTLIPVDFRSAGQIVDDDILDMLVKPMRAGVNCTVLMVSNRTLVWCCGVLLVSTRQH